MPVEIGELSKLQIIQANYSRLESIPSSIGQLKQLKILSLERNKLQTLPAELGMFLILILSSILSIEYSSPLLYIYIYIYIFRRMYLSGSTQCQIQQTEGVAQRSTEFIYESKTI